MLDIEKLWNKKVGNNLAKLKNPYKARTYVHEVLIKNKQKMD